MKYAYFEPSTLKTFLYTCNKIFESGDSGIFFFSPKTDMDMRIRQILQDYAGYFPYQIISLHIGMNENQTKEDIIGFLKKTVNDGNSPVGIFIKHAEIPIKNGNFDIFNELSEISEQNPLYNFIFLSEVDFMHPDIFRKLTNIRIFGSLHYYKLYDEPDMSQFVKYLTEKSNLKVPSVLVSKILRTFGGHTWLIAEAVRSIMLNNFSSIEQIIESDGIQFKIQQIYQSFIESEKSVLQKLTKGEISGFSENEKHSLKYLEKTGIVCKNKITIHALEIYIQKHQPKVSFTLEGKHIKINSVIVDSSFSRKQIRILRHLLTNNGVTVMRDELAKIIWPVNTLDYYTDWALDRIIARLRENIARIGLDKNLIQTVRGKGYKIQTNH